MMMNLPVVAVNVGAVSELVDDGATGFLVPPLDPAALSDAIVRTVDNPPLRAAMGARARERAIALCSVDECARLHLEAYDRALGHQRSYQRAKKRPFAGSGAKP
jgi:glycosyltransferase involved in cell wall biosynthesis